MRVPALLVLAFALLVPTEAGAINVQAGDLIVANGDGDNTLARIRPDTGESVTMSAWYGIADTPVGLTLDVPRDQIYMVPLLIPTGRIVRQEISTGIQYLASDWEGAYPVGSGVDLADLEGLLVDPNGTIVALTREEIIEVDPTTGERTLFASFASHPFHTGTGFLRLADGDYVVSNSLRAKLWRVDGTTGALTNLSSGFAGDVVGTGPGFSGPACLAHAPGDAVYVVNSGSGSIFLVDLATGDRSIVSDAATGTGPPFAFPRCLIARADGSLVVTDLSLDAVFVVDPTTGDRSILSSNSVGTGSTLNALDAIIEDADGTILVGGDGVTRIDPTTGNRTKVVEAETLGSGLDNDPTGFAWASDGSLLSDWREWGPGVASLDLSSGEATLITHDSEKIPVGTGPPLPFAWQIADLSLEPDGSLIHVSDSAVHAVAMPSGDRSLLVDDTIGTGPSFGQLRASARGPGDLLYVATWNASLGSLLAVDLATGDRVEVSGPGVGTGPPLGYVQAVAIEPSGSLVVCSVSAILRVDPVTGDRETLSGDGVGSGIEFVSLRDMAREHDGSVVVIDIVEGIVRVDLETGARQLVRPGPEYWSLAVVPVDPKKVPALPFGGLVVLALVTALAGRRELRGTRARQRRQPSMLAGPPRRRQSRTPSDPRSRRRDPEGD